MPYLIHIQNIRKLFISLKAKKERKNINNNFWRDSFETRRLKIITSSYRNGNETKNDMLLIHRSHIHVHIIWSSIGKSFFFCLHPLINDLIHSYVVYRAQQSIILAQITLNVCKWDGYISPVSIITRTHKLRRISTSLPPILWLWYDFFPLVQFIYLL